MREIDINDPYNYEHGNLHFTERTRRRLIQIKEMGMTEVCAAQFGVKGVMSGLYIEKVWGYSDEMWDDYIGWAQGLITLNKGVMEKDLTGGGEDFYAIASETITVCRPKKSSIRDRIIDKMMESNVIQWAIIIFAILLLTAVKCCGQTKDEVYQYIIASDVKHPEIVYKQVLYETGHLKCAPCSLQHNNLLGWRLNHKHMDFDSWQDSIDYYIGWQNRRQYSETEDYYEFLKRKWGAPNMDRYVETLTKIKT